MNSTRRSLFGKVAAVTVGAALPTTALQAKEHDDTTASSKRYGMLIDLRMCIGCQACTVSCSIENQAPAGQFRTTVQQYQVYDSNRQVCTNVVLPRICNQCDEPPCVPVCPVQATFQRKDGIVVVDNKRCVGCAYCVQACPYEARFINHETATADKCNFCVHRLEVGLLPACVESCVGGARIIGDMKDSESVLSKLLKLHQHELKVLKPEQGTAPQVFYLGLDEAFVGKIKEQGFTVEEAIL